MLQISSCYATLRQCYFGSNDSVVYIIKSREPTHAGLCSVSLAFITAFFFLLGILLNVSKQQVVDVQYMRHVDSVLVNDVTQVNNQLCRHAIQIYSILVKDVGRNLTRGGPQSFFKFQGGFNPDFWSLQWSK